jgi:hypothetical protein
MGLEGIMTIGKPRDGRKDRNMRARVKWRDDGYTEIHLTDQITNFKELLKLRIQRDPDELRKDFSKTEGHLVSAVGSAALLTTTYKGRNFLLLGKLRPNEGDERTLLKPIQGYIPAEILHDPEAHISSELAEEVLPMVGNRHVFWGTIKGKALENAYPDDFDYIDGTGYNYMKGNNFVLPSTRKGPIDIYGVDGKSVKALGDNAEVYSQDYADNQQIVFKYNVSLPEGWRLSLNCSEEVCVHRETGTIHTRLYDEGIVLLERGDDGKLNGKAYTLVEGKLIGQDASKIDLGEIFISSDDGITRGRSISFDDYLERQE